MTPTGKKTILIVLSAAVAAGMVALGLFFLGGLERDGRPNIVLVILDTVRRDYTGQAENHKGYTPHLDRLAAEGTGFENSWAPAPWTVPSHASMFTGLLPSEHGCNMKNLRLDGGHPTLAEILNRQGYETAAFFSNPWLSDRATGLLRGFAFHRETHIGGPNKMCIGRGDQGGPSTNTFIAQWLNGRSGRQPFFLFINYLEAHLPYDPPADYRREHLADLPDDDLVSIAWAHEFNAGVHRPDSVDWKRVYRLYGGDVHTTDGFLGDLVALLKQHDLYQDAVIIVTSDHGENLGEHGLVEHQFSVHETLLAVPLIVRAPGLLPPGERDEPVMLTDLFATVCELAGVENVDFPQHSRSLLHVEPGPPRPLIAEYAGGHASLVNKLRRLNPDLDVTPLTAAYRTVRKGKLRLTVGSDGSSRLHDMAADPEQVNNLAAQRPRDVAGLSGLLNQAQTAPGREAQLDEETKEKLRSLGYVE